MLRIANEALHVDDALLLPACSDTLSPKWRWNLD